MPAVDREAVKTLAIAIGIRPAARQLGLDEHRVLKWSQRDPAGPWIAKLIPAVPATLEHHKVSSCPQPLVSPSDAMQNSLADHSKRTRIALAKASTKATEHLAEQPAQAILKAAQNMRHVSAVAAQVHSWDQNSQQGPLTLNILTGSAAVQINQGNPAVSE